MNGGVSPKTWRRFIERSGGNGARLAIEVIQREGSVELAVKVVPRASRDRIVGFYGNRVKVTTSRPAQKGEANDAVVRLLAEALGVPAGVIQITCGGSSPFKTVGIRGVSAKLVRAGLEGAIKEKDPQGAERGGTLPGILRVVSKSLTLYFENLQHFCKILFQIDGYEVFRAVQVDRAFRAKGEGQDRLDRPITIVSRLNYLRC